MLILAIYYLPFPAMKSLLVEIVQDFSISHEYHEAIVEP